MLDFLIQFLQKKKKQQVLREKWEKVLEEQWKRWVILILWVLMICWTVWFWFFTVSEGWEIFTVKNLISFILGLLILWGFSKPTANYSDIKRYFYVIFVPLWVIISTLLFSQKAGLEIDSLLILLTGVYPLFSLFKLKKYARIRKIFFIYNMWFYVFLSLYFLLLTVWISINVLNPIWELMIAYFNGIEGFDVYSLSELFSFLVGLGLFLLLLTYPIYSLHHYFDKWNQEKKYLHRGIVYFLWAVLIVTVLSTIPDLKNDFYNKQIRDAYQIISKEWDNYESYEKARWQWFLERAFLNRIKKSNGVYSQSDRKLFAKLYDGNPESFFWEKIAEYTNNRRSFATDRTKVWEKAGVVLSLAEINNTIKDTSLEGFPVLETRYTFHFKNQTRFNQEVIIDFETPSKYSVISDLKLWLNGELQWEIAPRWAAKNVYEESLRRNIDPALLEKVGINTYTLRVFPVTAKNNSKTRGKQKVELTILTPIFDKSDKIEYSPKFSFMNLKFNDESGIVSKIYHNEALKQQDQIKKGDIEEYISSSHSLDIKDFGIRFNDSYCINQDLIYFIQKNKIETRDLKLKKVALFLDSSFSVKKNKAASTYSELYSQLKTYWGNLQDIDIFTYNAKVEKVIDINDIKYWGNSDTSTIIDYIEKGGMKDTRIIIVTDDDDFDTGIFENKQRRFEFLTTNQISVVKIWEGIKKYPPEFNNILAATSGNIYDLQSKKDIEGVLDKIFLADKSKEGIKVIACEKKDWDAVVNEQSQIWAWYIWNELLSQLKGQDDWERIAREQTSIASRYSIVNQFNSFIALETERQKRDLERYKRRGDKYDVKYNNFWDKELGRRFPPEPRAVANRFNGGLFGIKANQKKVRYSWSRGYSGQELSMQSGMRMDNINVASLHGRAELNFLSILLLCLYLIEFYSIFAFIIKYKNAGKNTKES